MDCSRIEKRRSKRPAVGWQAICTLAPGSIRCVVITDLSPQGCRIWGKDLALSRDGLVTIKPDGVDAVSTVVRWATRCEAGLEFLDPMQQSLADQLRREHAMHWRPALR